MVPHNVAIQRDSRTGEVASDRVDAAAARSQTAASSRPSPLAPATAAALRADRLLGGANENRGDSLRPASGPAGLCDALLADWRLDAEAEDK